MPKKPSKKYPKTSEFKLGRHRITQPNECAIDRRAKEFLNKLPYTEMVDSKELAAEVGVKDASLRHHSCCFGMEDYKVEVVATLTETGTHRGPKLFWGSKKTIADYKLAQRREGKNENDID